MEIPRTIGAAEDGGGDEYDHEHDRVFYEDIEAPKFVDLTAPDAACLTDDPSWFCRRIGCDQNHEQIDPDALHRSFVMRVMAARSPNVRLQKAISRRNYSLTKQCPQSAPAKPPRARFARLSTATEAAEKAARPRTHRICTLRASPARTKAARVEASTARKKALTTPRSKPVRPRQEPFLSVKHHKEPIAAAAAARKGTVAKALFMSTPKKDATQTPAKSPAPAVSEVCSRMRKLNLACREVPSRYLCPKTPKKCEDTATAKSATAAAAGQEPLRTDAKKKKILGRSVKHANVEVNRELGWNRNVQCTAADENACTETASSNKKRKEVKTLQAGNSDDDKENLSSGDQMTEGTVVSSHSDGENNMQQIVNSENVPLKVTKMQSKVNADQGGKIKKTITYPKPFRLRTDERQVLKEANSEMKQTLAENKSMAAIKDENRGVVQMGRYPGGKGRDKAICGEKQNKQNRNVGTCQLLPEAKMVLSSIRCNTVKPAMSKRKAAEKPEKVSRVVSSARITKATSGSMAPPQIGKVRKASVKIPRPQAAAA